MADKQKIDTPGKKVYSVKNMLTQERIQAAINAITAMQKDLLEALDDETYRNAEIVFDTAIASLMAHRLDVDIQEVGRSAGKEAAAPALKPAT